MLRALPSLILCALAACTRTPRPPPAPREAAYSGPVIDPHVHIFFDDVAAASMTMEGRRPGAEQISALLDASPRLTAGVMVIARGSPEEVRAQNDALLAFTQRAQAFPIASVSPADEDAALTELDRLAAQGVSWLKLHPNTQHFDVADPAVLSIVRRAGAHGMAVTFDASALFDADQLGKFILLAAAAPETDVVLAHMGMARFDELVALALLERYPWWQRNLWLELSAINIAYAGSPREEELRWLIRTVGTDRTLFASDYPLTTPEAAIEATLQLGLTPEEAADVFYRNAARLLGRAQ